MLWRLLRLAVASFWPSKTTTISLTSAVPSQSLTQHPSLLFIIIRNEPRLSKSSLFSQLTSGCLLIHRAVMLSLCATPLLLAGGAEARDVAAAKKAWVPNSGLSQFASVRYRETLHRIVVVTMKRWSSDDVLSLKSNSIEIVSHNLMLRVMLEEHEGTDQQIT